jgi:AraC-like DNA-binding protein
MPAARDPFAATTTQASANQHAGATTSVYMLLPFLRMLEASPPGVLKAALIQGERSLVRWGVTRAELEADPRKRLPFGLMLELLRGFVELLGDPAAPLRAGFLHQPGERELTEYLAASCATFGDSIRCVSRYYALLGPAELDLHIEKDRAHARVRIAPGLEAPDALNEFVVASNFSMSSLHIQRAGAQKPLEVQFTHAPPAHAAVFSEVFRAPVRFNCEHNGIVFPTSMLDHPMAKPDPALHAMLTRLADLELEALVDHSAFPAKVREAIEAELATGGALEAVAGRMHMSPSTLRSRLQQHGTNYSALLDRLRREHAKRALRQSQLSISEVAHRLGFAHPPAFHRAVRRWFGVTPNEYREGPSAHPATRFWRK